MPGASEVSSRPGTALEQAMVGASADLAAVSGGTSLCVLSRGGRPVPGVKYHEGRWAALREVARSAGSSPSSDTVVTACRAAHDSWTASLAALETRGAGADWLAYRTGGVDALAALLAELEPLP